MDKKIISMRDDMEDIMNQNEQDEVLLDGLEGEEEEATKEEERAAEEEEIGNGVIYLKKPIACEGNMVKKIPYDFNQIKPKVYVNIVNKISRKESVAVPALNINVQFSMFCKAAGMSVSNLYATLNVADFNACCDSARNFLLAYSEEEDTDILS